MGNPWAWGPHCLGHPQLLPIIWLCRCHIKKNVQTGIFRDVWPKLNNHQTPWNSKKLPGLEEDVLIFTNPTVFPCRFPILVCFTLRRCFEKGKNPVNFFLESSPWGAFLSKFSGWDRFTTKKIQWFGTITIWTYICFHIKILPNQKCFFSNINRFINGIILFFSCFHAYSSSRIHGSGKWVPPIWVSFRLTFHSHDYGGKGKTQTSNLRPTGWCFFCEHSNAHQIGSNFPSDFFGKTNNDIWHHQLAKYEYQLLVEILCIYTDISPYNDRGGAISLPFFPFPTFTWCSPKEPKPRTKNRALEGRKLWEPIAKKKQKICEISWDLCKNGWKFEWL